MRNYRPYSNWKICARDVRTEFKSELTSLKQERLLNSLTEVCDSFVHCYEKLKSVRAPTRLEVQRVDCVAVDANNSPLMEIHHVAFKNQSQNTPFNREIAKFNVRSILNKKGNLSVFGDSETETVLESVAPSSFPEEIRSGRSSHRPQLSA